MLTLNNLIVRSSTNKYIVINTFNVLSCLNPFSRFSLKISRFPSGPVSWISLKYLAQESTNFYLILYYYLKALIPMTQIGRIHKVRKKEEWRGKLTECEHQHVVALLCVAGADVERAYVWHPLFHFTLGVVVVLHHDAVEGLRGFVAQRLDRVVVITLPPDFIERTQV